MFSSLVQDKAAKNIAKYLNAETGTFNARQCNKVVSSAVGDLVRRRSNFAASPFPKGTQIMALLRGVVKHFESSPDDRKNHNYVLQEHRYLPRSALERDLSGARISTACNLIRSCLRLKQVVPARCERLYLPLFLT